MTFVRIRSWHILRIEVTPEEEATAVATGERLTRCGRTVSSDDPIVDTLPEGKSCETCLRIVARENDR